MNLIKLSIDQRKQFNTLYIPFINHISRFIVVLLSLLITYLRYPRYFLQPRFWAEEGSLHFAYSYSHNWLLALFHLQVGYLNFWPNLATLLATIPPLESAPLITTIMALMIQLIPIVLILWSKSSHFNGWLRKLIGISVLMFVPLSNEVWLNTINSYNFFAIITFLILLEDPPVTTARRWIYRILLLLGGLTGTLSCFLIPLFLVQVVKDKNKERLTQLFVLLVCALIQVYLIFHYSGSGNFSQRFQLFGFSTLGVTMWTQSLGLLAFGFTQASEWARALLSMITNDMAGFRVWGRLLFAVAIVLIFLLSANLPFKTRFLFIGGYGILMLLPMMFSVIQDKYSLATTGYHQRIFFAPNVLLGWMLLLGIRLDKRPPITKTNLVSLFCTLMLISALVWGLKSYPSTWFIGNYWPSWKSEVQIWKNNPDYPLRILPNNWVIHLQPR